MSNETQHAEIHLLDLANEKWGGAVLWANDEFFAEKENLIRATEPVWKEGVYTDRGKWMDGWESRRRRTPGHDVCIVRLGIPGTIEKVVVDTSYFRGNYPEACSIEGCAVAADASLDELEEASWHPVLRRSDLEGHHHNEFEVSDRRRFTHLRFHIYPDGGVARLRVYGAPVPDPAALDGQVDLVAGENGGATLAQSDMFFGLSQNLLKSGRGVNMGDGWETRRRRGPGHDWVVLRFAGEAIVEDVEVDTWHFKGNYPDRCSLELYGDEPGDPKSIEASAALFTERKLQAHTRHTIEAEAQQPATHAVFRIFPDGGVSRLRIRGRLTDRGQRSVSLRWLNTMTEEAARGVFVSCCGATRWVDRMLEELPFESSQTLLAAADEAFGELGESDWREAFAAHPKIGEKKAERKTTDQSSSWSEGEQAGTADAEEGTAERLAELNRAYYDKHGFIFIICATGKSADDMLGALERRLENDTDTEIENAAREQAAITKLRLAKWLTTH